MADRIFSSSWRILEPYGSAQIASGAGGPSLANVPEADRDRVVDVMMAVAGRMSGQPLGDEARPVVEAMAV
jgi:hypothetical protein